MQFSGPKNLHFIQKNWNFWHLFYIQNKTNLENFSKPQLGGEKTFHLWRKRQFLVKIHKSNNSRKNVNHKK